MIHLFRKLHLMPGDYMAITAKTGEVFDGIYEGNYDNSKETFEFRNHCSGRMETISIEELQNIEKR